MDEPVSLLLTLLPKGSHEGVTTTVIPFENEEQALDAAERVRVTHGLAFQIFTTILKGA